MINPNAQKNYACTNYYYDDPLTLTYNYSQQFLNIYHPIYANNWSLARTIRLTIYKNDGSAYLTTYINGYSKNYANYALAGWNPG